MCLCSRRDGCIQGVPCSRAAGHLHFLLLCVMKLTSLVAAAPHLVSCLQGGGRGAGGGVAGSHAGQTQLSGVSSRLKAPQPISTRFRSSVNLC